MTQLFANSAKTTLTGGISSTDLFLPVADTSPFPVPTSPGSDFILITLDDNAGHLEIVKVVSRSNTSGPGTLGVVSGGRHQESTSSLSFSPGARVEARLTAGTLTNFAYGNLDLYAYKDSPHLTGTPTAPDASPLTGTSQIATVSYVDNKFAGTDSVVPTTVHSSSSISPNPPVGSLICLKPDGSLGIACANDPATSELVGFVTVTGTTSFSTAMSGHVSGVFSGLTAGVVYYLNYDPVAAATPSSTNTYTNVPTSTPGFINRPVLLADSNSGGYILAGMRGFAVQSPYSDTSVGNSTQGLYIKANAVGDMSGSSAVRTIGSEYVNTPSGVSPQAIFVEVVLYFLAAGPYFVQLNASSGSLAGSTVGNVASAGGQVSTTVTLNSTTLTFSGAVTMVTITGVIPPGWHYKVTNAYTTGGSTPYIWTWKEYTNNSSTLA